MSTMTEARSDVSANGEVRPTAILVRPDGIEHYHGPLELEPLQAMVEGLVQVIDVKLDKLPEASMWLNEEGKYLGLVPNPIGTGLLAKAGGFPGDIVVGNVVITGTPDVTGKTQPVDDAWLAEFPESA